MLSLRELQRRFGASMLDQPDASLCRAIEDGDFTPSERLSIYRNTFYATLTQALRIAYPAVDRLVGREFFDAAAERFIRSNRPVSPCLNDYGEAFAGFLDPFEPAGALPYLGDVARFEWGLSVAANAPDVPGLTAQELSAIGPAQQLLVRLRPHPSVRIFRLTYPADEIADAVMAGDDAAMARIDVTPTRLWLATHRGAEGVQAQRIGADEYELLLELFRGEALGAVIRNASADAARIIAEQLAKGRLMLREPEQGLL